MSEEFDINKISAEVISDLAKNAAGNIIKKLTKVYKDIVNKEQVDYGLAFEKYLLDAESHISMAKTILYGQVPHHLYSFFECMNVCNRKKFIDTKNVNNLLNTGHKIIITGTGGIGKSMLMKHFFLDAIKNTVYIPILVELRGLNEYLLEDIYIENYIYNTLKIFGFKLEEEYYKYSLETGCYLILFDGYDEVKNSNSQKVTQEIIDFSNKYSDNYIVVSSRPLEEFVGWSDFEEYSTVKLDKTQALSLISKLDYDKELKDKFYKQLDEVLYDKYSSFASNPLLLTIMLMTFEERISIPDSKTDFYEQAFSILFHKHDAMKKGKYKREKSSNLGFEDFKRVFSYFCFRSFFKNQYEFTEKGVLENISRAKEKVCPFVNFRESDYLDDMTKAVCVLVHEGLNYRFSHRSFQEYFAAVYTTQLSDEEQKQFISSWLKSNSERMTTDFLDILYELQPDRFMKNILYDAICELHDLYVTHGCSEDWLIEYMYSGIAIHPLRSKQKRIYVCIKSSYYDKIFSYMLIYLHYKRPFYNTETYDKIIIKIEEKYKNEYPYTIPFERLKQDNFFDIVKKVALKWFTEGIRYVFNELEKIDVNSFGKKKMFEAMLEEL